MWCKCANVNHLECSLWHSLWKYINKITHLITYSKGMQMLGPHYFHFCHAIYCLANIWLVIVEQAKRQVYESCISKHVQIISYFVPILTERLSFNTRWTENGRVMTKKIMSLPCNPCTTLLNGTMLTSRIQQSNNCKWKENYMTRRKEAWVYMF